MSLGTMCILLSLTGLIVIAVGWVMWNHYHYTQRPLSSPDAFPTSKPPGAAEQHDTLDQSNTHARRTEKNKIEREPSPISPPSKRNGDGTCSAKDNGHPKLPNTKRGRAGLARLAPLHHLPERDLRLLAFLHEDAHLPVLTKTLAHALFMYPGGQATTAERRAWRRLNRLREFGLVTTTTGLAAGGRPCVYWYLSKLGKKMLNTRNHGTEDKASSPATSTDDPLRD